MRRTWPQFMQLILYSSASSIAPCRTRLFGSRDSPTRGAAYLTNTISRDLVPGPWRRSKAIIQERVVIALHLQYGPTLSSGSPRGPGHGAGCQRRVAPTDNRRELREWRLPRALPSSSRRPSVGVVPCPLQLAHEERIQLVAAEISEIRRIARARSSLVLGTELQRLAMDRIDLCLAARSQCDHHSIANRGRLPVEGPDHRDHGSTGRSGPGDEVLHLHTAPGAELCEQGIIEACGAGKIVRSECGISDHGYPPRERMAPGLSIEHSALADPRSDLRCGRGSESRF